MTAYTRTQDPRGIDRFVKNPYAVIVAGGHRTFGEYLNVNVQYVLRVVMAHADPGPDPTARQEAILSEQVHRSVRHYRSRG